jgi:hypothetical protein
MQGAQELRSEAHLQVRRNDEVEAQRSRWTFYEAIKFPPEFPADSGSIPGTALGGQFVPPILSPRSFSSGF